MGVARRTALLLRQAGHDAVHLGERGLTRLADEEILLLAAEEGRVVVTMDADFSALLALSGASNPSVVHVRVEGLDHGRMASLLEHVLAAVGDDLQGGCVASVTPAGIRVRRLPVAPSR